MKFKLFLFYLLISLNGIAQVGINTSNPTKELDVNGSMRIRSIDSLSVLSDYILFTDNEGVFQKISSDKLGFKDPDEIEANRFLGGTVYNKYNSTSNNIEFPDEQLINLGVSNYTIGTLIGIQPRKGSLYSIKGNGYKISNPSTGIYDIKFDNAFTQIYGVSVNIIDSGTNSNPTINNVGTTLSTTNNIQLTFISNTIVRVKTGNSSGSPASRSFTFLIVGQ